MLNAKSFEGIKAALTVAFAGERKSLLSLYTSTEVIGPPCPVTEYSVKALSIFHHVGDSIEAPKRTISPTFPITLQK